MRRLKPGTRRLAVLAAVAAPCACAAPDGADRAPPRSNGALEALASDFWDWYLAWHPLQATYLGDHRFDHQVEDITPAGREARRVEASRLAEALSRIRPSTLAPDDRLTYLALAHELQGEEAQLVCRPETWVVDHREGIQVAFLNVVTAQPLETPEDGARMIRRWNAMADYMDDYVSNLRAGLETGRVAARVSINRTIVQLDALLERPIEEWPLYAPAGRKLDAWPEEARHRFRADVREAATQRVRPAYARLRDFLRDELYEASRVGAEAGLAGMPGGSECYAALIRGFTTLDLSPTEIHAVGVAELAAVRLRLSELGERVLGTPDLGEIQRRLREDPAMHFQWPGEIVREAEAAYARAQEAMGDWFGRRPRAQVVIRPIPPYEAPHSIVAYYRQPAPDGSRPGTYFVNTYRPEIRPRYQAEVLTFHETIPGHHLQTAIAQELDDLPAFRRHLGSTAFVEGWALYAERLADEMGLYSSDLARLGYLSYDAWRASRLIVDTGIHALGWSRERAIAFLRDNTLLADANIENEVDRYITSPGQALAYKLGEREILALRTEARTRLGERFSIAEFHDRVLENGALSLPALREALTAWLGEAAAP